MDTLQEPRATKFSWKIRSFWLWAVFCSALWLPAVQANAAPPALSVHFPLQEKVGPLRAGRLCLPRAAVSGVDFVTDSGQFALLVRQALDVRATNGKKRLGDGASVKVDLTLTALSAKLCAKSWGVMGFGDTKSLSGVSNFTFMWRHAGEAAEPVKLDVSVRTETKDGMTPPLILRRAIEVALDRIDPD